MTLSHEEFNKNVIVSCGKSILDVGCGIGRYYEWAMKYNLSYTGIDIDPEVVKKAILKYRTNPNFDPDTFHISDGKSLSMFGDKSFDTLLLVEVIEHICDLPTLKNLLKDCMRVARKNIFLTTPNCSDEDYLRKCGLIYVHYTHSVGQGYNFKMDNSHNHHLRFTKESLSEVLSELTTKFEVVEKKPIPELKKICFYKLWGEITI